LFYGSECRREFKKMEKIHFSEMFSLEKSLFKKANKFGLDSNL